MYGGAKTDYFDFVRGLHSDNLINGRITWHEAVIDSRDAYEEASSRDRKDIIAYGRKIGSIAKGKKRVVKKRKPSDSKSIRRSKGELSRYICDLLRGSGYDVPEPSYIKKGLLTKLSRGEIEHAPSIGYGGYGTKAGARKAVRTKLSRGEIKNAPSLGRSRSKSRKSVKDGRRKRSKESIIKGLVTKLENDEIAHSKVLSDYYQCRK